MYKLFARRFLFAFAFIAVSSTIAPTQEVREYDIKAVFLYNFTQFVDWPADALRPQAPLIIGVLGQDPFGSILDDVVKNERVKGHPLVVRRFTAVEQVQEGCHVLFISRSMQQNLPPLTYFHQRSILTVSDMPGWERTGGIIGFYSDQNRIRLRINLKSARAARLTLSSKLLRVAQLVED